MNDLLPAWLLEYWPTLLQGTALTLLLSAAAWVVAVLLGLLLVLLGELRQPFVQRTVAALITVLRGLPEIVVIFLIFYGLGRWGIDVGPLAAAILALGLVQAGFAAEIFRAALRTVPRGSIEAGRSIGLTEFGIAVNVIVPLASRFALPPLTNVFVALLKLSVIAAAVGTPELLYRGQALMNITLELLPVTSLLLAIFVVITLPFARLARYLEDRLKRGVARAQ